MALLDRIANYFKEWDGIDETAPKMELNIHELRYIANMNVERCRLIRQLNEANLKIDEFAEALKERLKGMQMVELQGEDVCPCSETGEECPYINQDIGCQYCARERTIKDIEEIAEQMKGEQNERLQ